MPKNKKNKAFIYLLLLCLLYVGGQQRVWGQDVYPPGRGWDDVDNGYPKVVVPPDIPLKQRVKAASAVFEGRIVDTYYVTTKDEKKYTCFVVEVYRIFKGNFVADTVDVISSIDWETCKKDPNPSQSFWKYGIGVFFTEPTTKFDAFTQSTRKKFQFYNRYYGHIEEFERLPNLEMISYLATQQMQTLHKSIAKHARKKPKVVKEIYKKNCQKQSSLTAISATIITAGNLNTTATGFIFFQNTPPSCPKTKKTKHLFTCCYCACCTWVGSKGCGGKSVYPPGRGWDDVDNGYPKVVVPPDIPLKQRVKAASAVFEGRVVDRYKITTEDAKKYNCFVVQVYRIFKGNFVADTVEVITFTDLDTYRKSFSYTESIAIHGIYIFFTEPTTKFDAFTQSTRKKFQFYNPYYGFIEEIERLRDTQVTTYESSQETQTLHKSIAKYAHKKPKVVTEIYKKNCP